MASPTDEPDTQEFALVAPPRVAILGRCAFAVALVVPALLVIALMMAFATR